MKVTFDPTLKAHLTWDEGEKIRQINHFQEYWLSEHHSTRAAAIEYLQAFAGTFKIPENQLQALHHKVSFLEPVEKEIEYHLSEEKHFFDSSTYGFYQTYKNVPVWQAGLTATVKQNPNRIVSSTNTSQDKIQASLPSEEVIARYKKLFSEMAFTKMDAGDENADLAEESLVSNFKGIFSKQGVKLTTKKAAAQTKEPNRLIRGRFFVYQYDPEKRLPKQPENVIKKGKATYLDDNHPEPILPLPPVSEEIREGEYYFVAEITFSLYTAEYDHLTWLALIELETGSVLYLRALASGVNGLVFVQDPISATGNGANTPSQNNATLNPLRNDVALPNLIPPILGIQPLRGTYANVTNVEDPNVSAPVTASGTDFDYDVRSNNFAAVNAYYHTDRFFRLVEDLGFPIATYFNNTTFPIPVDHRDLGNAINAHCIGNGVGGIGHAGYALNDTADTVNPIGIALDWRVHLHELGGHGILYEHVNSANFGFAHSAGDSLAVILNDPESQAPDRFLFLPWVPAVVRRFDREVAAGWGWGGTRDTGGYSSEQILATTLFRIYRSLGGDSTNLNRRIFASRMAAYLIFRTISTFTPATNPNNALSFCNAMMGVDLLNWTSEGVFGGAYNKVIRWSFEKQGLFQPGGAPTPVISPGSPPNVDVYIDDGRAGEYQYQAVHWHNTNIWNRRNPDGLAGHQEPGLGVTNYAYVKIKNRGTQTANNVVVKGFHTKPGAGLLWPGDFEPFTTAQINVGSLPGNNSTELIVGPFQWTPNINAYGHDCVLMIVSATGDASNIDNFTAGEVIPEWRLVPNDNNVGQRNVNPVPGGGGIRGLIAAISNRSFWVGNPFRRRTRIDLQVSLPRILETAGWHLSFKGIAQNSFDLKPGEKREVVMILTPGEDFTKNQVENTTDRDIMIAIESDQGRIGGMTYRLDPEIKEPYNKPGESGKPDSTRCVSKAKDLLDCLNITDQEICKVKIKKVSLDIEMSDDGCC